MLDTMMALQETPDLDYELLNSNPQIAVLRLFLDEPACKSRQWVR